MEYTHGLPVSSVANDRVVEAEKGTTHYTVRVQSSGHRENDGKSATATAAEGLVEVRVLIWGRYEVLTVDCDNPTPAHCRHSCRRS